MKSVCLVVSSVMTAKVFLLDQIIALSRVYCVYVVANTADTNFLRDSGVDVKVLAAPIERKISLFSDLRALVNLFWLFRRHRFDVVHSVSPKAGLLSMIAAVLARVPVRIHTFTGQVWATRAGLIRTLLKNADRILAFFATHVLVDSFSQHRFLLSEKIVSAAKSRVLAKGSISGVDTVRFRPDPDARLQIRRELGIQETATVFLYVGRVNRDKGLLDLAVAFSMVGREYPAAYLLIVGPDEDGMQETIKKCCGLCADRVSFVDYTDMPERFMASADVFCLPSYREGFGSVIIEAAAVGIPTIGSRIYGITDAIEDGVTGLMHSPGDPEQIAERMHQLLQDPALRRKMGENARLRARRDFSKEEVTSALLGYYRAALG